LAHRLTDASVAASRQTEALKANAARLAWLSSELEATKESLKSNAEAARASVRTATDDVEMLRAEKSSLEGALDQARSDRLALQREVTQLKRELTGRISAGGRRGDPRGGASNGGVNDAPGGEPPATDGTDEIGALRADRTNLQREVARLKHDLSAGQTELEVSNAALRQRIEQVADAIMRRPPAKPAPAKLARPKTGRARS
jgi:chromosome segregation ATPase